MSIRRYGLIVAVVALLLAGCRARSTSGIEGTPTARDSDGSLVSGGFTRTYHVHLPPQYDGAHALPLVFVFHGGGGTGSGMITLSHMNGAADQYGFIAVYPDGYGKSWADGRGITAAEQAGIDDVAFISALIDALEQQYKVQSTRIYATGISNGGFFSERLACDLADKIAASVSDAAPMTTNLAASCTPSRPVPFMLIDGTADPIVPFNGGPILGSSVLLERGESISAPDAVAKWVSLDHCAGSPTTQPIPDTAHDGTQVTLTTYVGCAGSAQVAFYQVTDGGHTWPSGEQYLPVIIVGKTTHQIDNTAIWQFLQRFALG